MNLVRCTAAGRLVSVGPRLFLLSPPSLRGFATLLSHLSGVVPRPEFAPPDWLPELADEAAFAEYATPVGSMLLLYVTTRRDHPDVTLEEIAALIADSPPDDAATSALIRMAFIRQEHATPGRKPKDPDDPDAKPKGIESLDFGPIFERDTLERFSPQTLAEMSVDQFENALMGGKLKAEDELSMDEVMEIYEANRPKAGPGTAPDAGPAGD